MRKRIAALAATSATICALAATTTASAQETRATETSGVQQMNRYSGGDQQAISGCVYRGSLSGAGGSADWYLCDGVHAIGEVKDDKADGRCPFVMFRLSNSEVRTSNWAGPKGDTSPIDVWAAPGTSIIDAWMSNIAC
ncbi:hypothetical protein FCH28_24365 [Streptomyces piniterrae]|uniref:Secreted protein n=1 Tax=Streptomyces piniterrae TaxID=2571125 RepID=A0A4U0N7D0_9ACTN|nr:hypothetical protein [Streptomyces piniterrae]TJZ49453.1 hypothetical protein FCH28_24365 [Streptomyces piniterrae]